MDANAIRLGTKFELEVPEIGANGDENKKSYVSQLLDIIDSKTISIAAPMYENRLKFLSNGLKIDIFFLNETQELLCNSTGLSEERSLRNLSSQDTGRVSENSEKKIFQIGYNARATIFCSGYSSQQQTGIRG